MNKKIAIAAAAALLSATSASAGARVVPLHPYVERDTLPTPVMPVPTYWLPDTSAGFYVTPEEAKTEWFSRSCVWKSPCWQYSGVSPLQWEHRWVYRED